MGYHLGVDLGTTYAAAAIAREGRAETVPLGHRAAVVPTVLYLAGTTVIVGEAANRRATTEPHRVARAFKRRIGDPTPVVVDGTPYSPEALLACVGRWMTDEVVRSEGGLPGSITMTFPAAWGSHRLDKLRAAVHAAGIVGADGATPHYLDEPTAAATFYASQRPLAAGSVLAVYDLGGGTFDATLIRRTDTSFVVLGSPTGTDNVGGLDFDDAVFAHVLAAIGLEPAGLDTGDPAMTAALAQLRADCVAAKESLSAESAVTIAVLLPGKHTEVRLTRTELEEMIRPAIGETVNILSQALASSGAPVEDVSAVLLVGGSSRIPLVAQLVGAATGRPIVVDARPKDAIALGAALHGWNAATAVASPAPPPLPSPAHIHRPRNRRTGGRLAALAVVGLAAVAVTAAAVLGGDDRGGEAARATTTTTGRRTTTTATAPPGRTFFTVETGQCVAVVPTGEVTSSAELAACDAEHQGEAIATFDLVGGAGTPFPGDELVREQALGGCEGRFETFVGISFQASRLQLRAFRPSSESWDLGDRRVYCVVHDNGAPMIGSVEGTLQ